MVAHSARTKKSTLAPVDAIPEVAATEQAENLSLRRLSVDYLVHAGSANAQGGAEDDAKYCQTLPNSGSKTAVSTKQLWTSGSSTSVHIKSSQLRAAKRQLRAVKLPFSSNNWPFPPNNCGDEQEGGRKRNSEAQKFAGEGNSPLDQEVREREVT